jgi:hypothetical protein
MKYPGHYVKGAPHVPVVTAASHFTGMCASEDASLPATEAWYRGDDYAAVVAERDRLRAGMREVLGVFDKNDPDILDFLEIAERCLK